MAGLLQSADVRKKELFLFPHVGLEVHLQALEQLPYLQQFRMSFAVNATDFVEQAGQSA
jgi:hypothetical protein